MTPQPEAWGILAVYHLNLWMHTLVELWAWGRSRAQLCDRKDSPWGKFRRPAFARGSAQRLAPRVSATGVCTAYDQQARHAKIRQLFARLTEMVA